MRKAMKRDSDDLVLLANGPSLKEVLSNLNKDEFQNKDFGVVNYLANDPCFLQLKPKYYILSDEQFFIDNHPSSSAAKELLMNMNARTTWDMLLLIPYNYYKKNTIQAIITNNKIKVIPFHHYSINGPKNVRFYFYKKGLGHGEFGTVIQNGIYCGINMRYQRIHLYGVDHNFFDNLVLDESNILCQKDTHFYDNGEIRLRKITYIDGTPKPVHSFLKEYSTLFEGHYFLNDYATYIGCKIINHTKNSLIDAYSKARD
jgi:hypothetical protein